MKENDNNSIDRREFGKLALLCFGSLATGCRATRDENIGYPTGTPTNTPIKIFTLENTITPTTTDTPNTPEKTNATVEIKTDPLRESMFI